SESVIIRSVKPSSRSSPTWASATQARVRSVRFTCPCSDARQSTSVTWWRLRSTVSTAEAQGPSGA
ncbi:MAG: hypothetical protein ACK55Z_16975, partial [bacterium]